ncbi:uncharacterized protein LY89DRAFT_736090 [Mollisia scopiformis]|uniref:Zn(2)-C6 fungal-type domain-containing protein n=1 Tax=Mollisia scopiformis TaxID=149040 RepID=A0A194X4C9_MOLSC|nr:uncharacterized protein LY89DRAFT_736090 [Mollisia scopiformis]KUJ15030.1 hypothetical protein LY89DRAFT_736090 [Mollisia scopiformis]
MPNFTVMSVSSSARDRRGKPRLGARGIRKVKTGCKTCKIRRKKCDEIRPACSQCSDTGRRCDFSGGVLNHLPQTSDIPLARKPEMSFSLRPSLPCHMRDLTYAEASHLDYFRLVCAKSFALSLDATLWENLLLQNVHLEPSIYHAALTAAALSRHQYCPMQAWYDRGKTNSPIEFAIVHYNLAIRIVNERLGHSAGSSELAVLASIIFAHVEAFQNFRPGKRDSNLISAHLNGGLAIVHSLKSTSQNIDHLEAALTHMQTQMEQFEQYSARYQHSSGDL